MLDAFEARLLEVLRDGLAGAPALGAIERPRDGLAAPTGDTIQVRVRLLDARPRPEVGDDEPLRVRREGAWQQRLTLRLEGEIELTLQIGPAAPPERPQQRARLLALVDRVLLFFADEALRTGQALRTDDDRGFDVEGLRLAALEAPRAGGDDDARRFTLRLRYLGRFWPISQEPAGPAITGLALRQLLLPIDLPAGLRVKAGEDLAVPLTIPVGATQLGSAALPEPTLVARLLGASPGELLGPADPAGWTLFHPDPADRDRFVVRYRAPNAVTGKAEARVALALAREGAPRVELGLLKVEVHA